MKQLKALPTKVKWILAGGVAFWLVVFAAIPTEPIETEEAWTSSTISTTIPQTTTSTSVPTTTVTSVTTTSMAPTSTTTTPSTTTSTTTVPAPSLEELEAEAAELVLVMTVQDDYPDAGADGIISVGYEMCDVMTVYKEAGMSVDDYVLSLFVKTDGDEDAVMLFATISGAAAGSICNELLPWSQNEGVGSPPEQVCGDREAEPCAPDCSSTCQEYILDA